MLYVQTTEQQKYLAAISKIAPSTLSQLVGGYKTARALVLGLAMGRATQPGQPPQLVQQANLLLPDRIAALGTDLVTTLTRSAELKAFIEDQAAKAAAGLGGWSSILPSSDWGFLLADVVKDGSGTITGYSLPGLPFTYTNKGAVYTINITPNQDGTGTAVITPQNPAAQAVPVPF